MEKSSSGMAGRELFQAIDGVIPQPQRGGKKAQHVLSRRLGPLAGLENSPRGIKLVESDAAKKA